MATPFSYLNYRKYLMSEVEERKTSLTRKTSFQQLAASTGIQKTYLSKVLSGRAHLNSDQLYAMANELNLSESESDYLLLLLELDRSQNSARKEKLKRRISEIQSQNLQTDRTLTDLDVVQTTEFVQGYSLDVEAQMIHMLLTIDSYAENPEKIAAVLKISMEQLREKLKTLERLGIVRQKQGHRAYRVEKDGIHLPSVDTHFEIFRKISKLKSLENQNKKNYSFSGFLTTNEQTSARIRDRMLKTLKEIQEMVKPSSSKGLYQISLELLDWNP
jgi:uncharacterized protein (TIGR02147 family)